MFSYRHSFHAGNHADIFKHLCLSILLEKLREKSKPFIYMDTHSGAGSYDLSDKTSQKTGEFRHGVVSFLQHPAQNPELNAYQSALAQYYAQGIYPGSPQVARDLLRAQDKMVCMEWHNNEIANLKRNIRADNAVLHHRDGFEGLVALSPPKPSRGLVLLDPPYERVDEYGQVVAALTKATGRWQTGIFAVWLPLLSERAGSKVAASNEMVKVLASLPVKNVLFATFCPYENTPDAGMYGSAMLIINCPWQVDEKIRLASNELLSMLGKGDAASTSVDWLKESE